MVNIQSPTAEIRRGKKKEEEEEERNSMKIYMVSLLHRATINKLFKKLRDTDTVDRRPGSGRPRIACTEDNAKFLLQKFLQSATYFVVQIVR